LKTKPKQFWNFRIIHLKTEIVEFIIYFVGTKLRQLWNLKLYNITEVGNNLDNKSTGSN